YRAPRRVGVIPFDTPTLRWVSFTCHGARLLEDPEPQVPARIGLDVRDQNAQLHEQGVALPVQGGIVHEEPEGALTAVDLSQHRVAVRQKRVEPLLSRGEPFRE